MCSILHDGHPLGTALFNKVQIERRIAIITADKQETDFTHQTFIKQWNEMLVHIIIINLVACFYKASADCLTCIGGQIGSSFCVLRHTVLKAEIDGTAAGHQMPYITGVWTYQINVAVFFRLCFFIGEKSSDFHKLKPPFSSPQ